MNFNFGETAGASQNSRKATLEGNKIHNVTFAGCEARTIEGVKDPNAVYNVLDIKFENEDGVFTQTYFEPRDSDMQDRPGTFGDQPSAVKSMMLFFKHLLDAVNPVLAAEIDAKTKSMAVSTWTALRQFMVAHTTDGIGTKTKIKLIKNKKGEAIFPYFAAYTKDAVLYVKTNFIGDKVFFSDKELATIDRMSKATPTAVEGLGLDELSSSKTEPLGNLDFSL